MLSNDEKQWGMLCHLAALSGFIGVPYGNVLGPLIVWLWKRPESAYVDAQGKESLNFHISVAIYGTVAALLCLVIIGWILLPVVYLVGLICTIQGAVKASNGEHYAYPFTIRFLS